MRYLTGMKDHVHSKLGERGSYYKKIIKELNLGIFESHLDLGCGSGDITKAFSTISKHSTGIDIDISKTNKYPGIKFEKQNIYNLKNGSYDLVTAVSFFEHLPDIEKAVKIVSKINNRYLIVQIPNKYFFVDLQTYLPLQFLFPLKLRLQLIKLGYSEDSIRAGQLSKRRLIQVLKRYYEVEQTIKLVYPENLLPHQFRPVHRLFKRLGIYKLVPFGYILICKKN